MASGGSGSAGDEEEAVTPYTKLRGITILSVSLVCAPNVEAWSSRSAPFFQLVHQRAIAAALEGRIGADALKLLQDQQAVVDEDQEPIQSAAHAMTGIENGHDEKTERPNYIRKSEEFVRERLQKAIDANRTGDTVAAFTWLGKAIHPLTDSSSPVHRGFQTWRYDESYWSITRHVFAERVYPTGGAYGSSTDGLRARLEGSVRWAYDIFTGTAPFPPSFFDPGDGRLLLPSKYGGGR